MNPYKKIFWICTGILTILGIPYIAAYINFEGTFPDGYFNYPALTAQDKPGFSLPYFLVVLGLVLFTISLYLVPQLYGFKPVPIPPREASKTKLPWWFWAGIPIALIFQVLAWGKFSQPAFLVQYSYVPLFWAYAMVIDGIVYKRENGESFINKYGSIFFSVSFCSGLNWAFFGYLNFFLGGNWYYPDGGSISVAAFVIYAFLGSMTLAPMVFVSYHLLNSFPALRIRYTNGPKIKFSLAGKLIVFIIMGAGMFAVPFYPNLLYPFLWVGPTFIMAAVLSICNIWTPLTPIKEGNWGPLAMIALAGFVEGFLWEGMNYFSASHTPFSTHIPGYWIYSIPYVELGHIFEMPALGFFGYMPYGLFCWIFWIGFAELMHIPPAISKYCNK